MALVARLTGIGTFLAYDFDETAVSKFRVSNNGTAYSNEFDENTATTLSGSKRMSATSSGGLIVYDSINEIDPLGDIPTSGLQVHLDSVDSAITTSGGGASSAAFNFRYHAYGADTGSTTFYWYNTTTSTLNTLTTISGQQHTSNADEWDAYSLDLSSYAGETGKIVIRYSTGGGFNQDPALDEMELVDTTSGTINLDPSNTQPNGGWEQQGGNSSTYPTTGYSALTTNQEDPNDYWQYDVNGTPSSNSGPDQDFNNNGSSTPAGYYIYFEGSSPNNQTGVYGWLQTSSTYTLETGATTYWEDLTANNRDATLTAGASKVGDFISLDGVDDYANISGYKGITGTGARTSIIFFKTSQSNISPRLFGWGTTNTGEKWNISLDATTYRPRAEVAGGAVVANTTTPDVTDQLWHMVASSVPASGTVNDIKLYVDGELITDTSITNGTTSVNTASGSDVSLGASQADASPGYLNGSISQFLIYNRQLSDFEIKIVHRSILYRFG